MDEKIIKAKLVAEAAGGLPHKVVPHEIYEGRERAREIVEAAHVEARRILDEAGREAAAIRESAFREGFEQGLANWNQAVADALEARSTLLRESQHQLAHVAIRVAEKIIGERLQTEPSTIVSIVAEALKNVRRERDLTIQVNPEHAEEVRCGLDRLQAALGGSRTIQVAASAGVPPGGCVVESEFGTIDARLETQLNCLERALRRAAGK
jgi:type III secretion protein L